MGEAFAKQTTNPVNRTSAEYETLRRFVTENDKNDGAQSECDEELHVFLMNGVIGWLKYNPISSRKTEEKAWHPHVRDCAANIVVLLANMMEGRGENEP